MCPRPVKKILVLVHIHAFVNVHVAGIMHGHEYNIVQNFIVVDSVPPKTR